MTIKMVNTKNMSGIKGLNYEENINNTNFINNLSFW
jgi:hypothetical protein